MAFFRWNKYLSLFGDFGSALGIFKNVLFFVPIMDLSDITELRVKKKRKKNRTKQTNKKHNNNNQKTNKQTNKTNKQTKTHTCLNVFH